MNARMLFRLGVALSATVVLSACRGTAADEGEEAASELARVGRASLNITAEASGQVEPVLVVEVKSKASGEILKLHVETGMTVAQGALLAEVDPRDVRNAYEQADADLQVATERAATATAQRQRVLELRDANVVTAQELESANLEEANARAQIIKARTNLVLARERLNDVAIRAPIAGTIIAKTVEQGTIIASASQNISGGTALMQMADLSVMQVRALIDETDIGRIQPGMTSQVTVEAYPDRRFRGTVYKIEPQAVVEQNVTMFPVLVRLDNPEGLLKPGMNADIAVEIAQRENVLTVPNEAIVAVTDAVPAGQVLGLSEEQVQTGLRGGGAAPAGGAQPASAGAQRPGGAAPAAAQGGPPAAGAQAAGTRTAGAGAARGGAAPGGAAAAAPAAAGSPQQAECQQLMTSLREGGGFQSMSEADRTKLRACRTVLGLGGRAGMAGQGGTTRNPDVRPAVVFVQGQEGPEARRIMVGVNDFDNTEVISGVQEGENIILISVARLQAQQEEFTSRMRERSSAGNMLGGGGMAAPGGPGGGGGGRGGR